MAIDLSAIKAAAEELKQLREQEARPKSESKRTSKAHADTKKSEGGASYVIPKEFKEAIEGYLYSRPDIIEKLAAPGKSIDGCCEYIFGKMLKVAKANRKGKSAVGIFRSPEEIYSMAVHYYDETDEDLKQEDKK